jgi:hypothetical protein
MKTSRLTIAFRGVGVLAVLAAALHCGGSNSGSTTTTFAEEADVCKTAYAGECGKTCTSDLDCDSALHCGPGSTCTAECTPSIPCANGGSCSTRGACTRAETTFVSFGEGGLLPLPDPPDASASDVVCADTNVDLTQVLPKVLLLLDQSASMFNYKFDSEEPSNGCNPSCRWSVLKDVIIGDGSPNVGLVKQIEKDADLDVKMYSATDPVLGDGDDSYLTTPTDDVCPRFNGKAFSGLTFAANNYASIDALLRPAGVDDDTPTGPAIRTVIGLGPDGNVVEGGFASITSASPKVMVLVTDGEPMLCGESGPSAGGREAVISAVQDTYRQNIRTFVIAIGSPSAEATQHFNAVANAGAGLDPTTGNATAILPSTQQQLIDTLRQIVLDARTCTFDLHGAVQPSMERLGTVMLNGARVPFAEPGAPDEGWRLVTPSRIELLGSACTTLKATPNGQLTAHFPCEAVILPPDVPK